MSEQHPETSIVIRSFNEERWLPDVFAALAQQRNRDFEVVLVDSGSIDRTRDIAAAHGARIVRLRSEDFTFGHSLNLGVRESRGSLIAIVSAHAIPADPDWLENLVAPLRQPETAMVYGGQRGHPVSKFSEARDFERIFPQRGYVVDVEDPRDRLLLEPLARVALLRPGRLGEALRGEPAALAQHPVVAEAVAEVDGQQLVGAERGPEEAFREGVALRLVRRRGHA